MNLLRRKGGIDMLLENWFEVTFVCKVYEFGKMRMQVKAASSHAAMNKASVLVPKFWDVREVKQIDESEVI